MSPPISCSVASLLYVLYRTIRSRLAFEIPLIQYSSFHEGNPRWKAIEDSLGQIQNILQRHGIPFIVVASGRDDEAHMRLLHEAAHRAGFRFAVLDHSRDTRWRADDPGRFVISATNNHCNPLGCAIIASLLYNILAQQGVLK